MTDKGQVHRHAMAHGSPHRAINVNCPETGGAPSFRSVREITCISSNRPGNAIEAYESA